MKQAFCVLGIISLGFSAAVYASDATSSARSMQAHPTRGVAASFTIDYVTHQVTPGQAHGRQTPIYDNTASPSGFFGGDMALNEEAGDDLVMLSGGTLAELDGSIGNNSAVGDINTCDLTFTFRQFDNTTVVGSFTTTIDFGSSPLAPGYLATFTITGLGGNNIVLPSKVILTTAVTAVTGGADTFELGIYNPTAAGDSADAFWDTAAAGGGPGWYWFTNDPVANLYYGIRVDPVSGDSQVWTDGQPRGVTFNGAVSNLGYISGRLASAGFNQRWAAIPFKVTEPNTTIDKVDIYWFETTGSEPNTVDYIIWHRTGLTAPTNGTQFVTGTLGAFDPNNGGGENGWDHTYTVSIPIPVGDYYLTIYGNGGVNQDAVVNWLTGGEKQDPNLEQSFMWRSQNFPTPGFQQYNPSNIAPGPGATDPLGIWNPSFVLWMAAGAPICRGDMNCDGFVNFGDINPFVAILGGATPCNFANADVNGDGHIDFGDINPFVALLAAGGGPCP